MNTDETTLPATGRSKFISYVWDYFIYVNSKTVKCRLCRRLGSLKRYNTSSMRNHLKINHNDQYMQLKKKEQNKEERPYIDINATNAILACSKFVLESSPNVVESVNAHHNNITSESDRIEYSNIYELIGELLIKEDLPSSLVESEWFTRLMKHSSSSYGGRSKFYYESIICETIFRKIIAKVTTLLDNFEAISFTTDLLSDDSTDISLMNLTCHGITKDFERERISLITKAIDENERGAPVINIEDCLKYWSIPWYKTHCLVKSHENELEKCSTVYYMESTYCSTTLIQAAIQDSIESQIAVSNLVDKCRAVAKHFNQSKSAKLELERIQAKLQLPILEVLLDHPTKLNSTFYMLNRFEQVEESIGLYMTSQTNNELFTSEEWMLIKKLVYLLNPFEEAITELSNDKTSVSSVLPIVISLKRLLEELKETDQHIEEFICILNNELLQKFGVLETDLFHCTATFLDPRYKSTYFNNRVISNEVITNILYIHKDRQLMTMQPSLPQYKEYDLMEMEEGEIYDDCKSIKESVAMVLDEFDDEYSIRNDDVEFDETLKYTILEYTKEECIQPNEDPLSWWKANSKKYKLLVPIAMRFLSTPSSTVPTEKFFNDGRIAQTLMRSEKDPLRHFFIKFNVGLLKNE